MLLRQTTESFPQIELEYQREINKLKKRKKKTASLTFVDYMIEHQSIWAGIPHHADYYDCQVIYRNRIFSTMDAEIRTPDKKTSCCSFRIWSSKVRYHRDTEHCWNYGTINYFLCFSLVNTDEPPLELACVTIYNEQPMQPITNIPTIDLTKIDTQVKYVMIADIDSNVIFAKTFKHIINPTEVSDEQRNIRHVLLAGADDEIQ